VLPTLRTELGYDEDDSRSRNLKSLQSKLLDEEEEIQTEGTELIHASRKGTLRQTTKKTEGLK